MSIYLRWLEVVKPIIAVDWDDLKKSNILAADFYLADLFVDDKGTPEIIDDTAIYENLFVIFEKEGYKIPKKNLKGTLFDATISLKDKTIYQNFWKHYKRPPHSDYHDYIIERRDKLVPQDVRERKGAFFTPKQWVALSQQYLADYLGDDWQDEYYIWDCAAGTGNLLAGLTNRYHIFASTLDQADVNVMHERIQHGAELLDSHVFQFDFLNDEFIPQKEGGKLPDGLFEIINDNEKRKKLVVYINPPYKRGLGVASETKWHKDEMGGAKDELFAQFIYRIYTEIPKCQLAEFSKLKILQAPNFSDFRKVYRAKLEKIFLVPADTFDNVKGQFPIGFKIWNTAKKESFSEIKAEVYDHKANLVGEKVLFPPDKYSVINLWLKTFTNDKNIINSIGILNTTANDFQHKERVRIESFIPKGGDLHKHITLNNLLEIVIYLYVRHSMPATWLNDRDQFLYPIDGWQNDKEFQSDCLAFTLFHGQNRITAKEGANHWIPFTEKEVNAPTLFASHFMTDFIQGKLNKKTPVNENLFTLMKEPSPMNGQNNTLIPNEPLVFSSQAQAVFATGRELWKYYFTQPNANANASLYDIREHFQGRNDKGKMNNKSEDNHYNQLISDLREALAKLAKRIEVKVYEYRFLI